MKAIAPGKIILSGEHAVVYGKPALVMAVNRYATALVFPQKKLKLSIDLLDFESSSSLTVQALRELKQRLYKNYHMFLNGELGIRDVLKKPFELFEFLFITLLDGLQLKMDKGVNIQLSSNIPIGCGMGSSAATILSVLKGVGEFFKLDLNPEKYYDFGLEAEKLQHGQSSGVDPYVSLYGGFVRFQQKKATKLPMPQLPFYIVNTGNPSCTTGECVFSVANKFKNDKIWDDFGPVTNAIQKELQNNKLKELLPLIKENHLLLTHIGVVPKNIQHFINDIEKNGGAAKIAGAGAVYGENGGIVTIFAEDEPKQICEKYGFKLVPVKGEPLGARIV
jgi:mevalonate kinase